MDYQNGNYGYPPYDEDPNAGGQDPNAPQPYHEDPAGYGATPINYGQSPNYDAGNGGYSMQGGAYEPGNSSRPPRTNYSGMDSSYAPSGSVNYGGQYPADGSDPYAQQNPYAGAQNDPYAQQNSYAGASNDPYAQQNSYAGTPNDPYASRRMQSPYVDPDSAYATRVPTQGDGYVPRGSTGRTSVPRGEDGYGYSSRGTSRTQMPRGEEEYGYVPRGSTSRTQMAQDDEYASRGSTSRTRYPQSNREYDDESYEREPRPQRSGKKKRSKFGKFMHALGLYLAQLPAKTLVIIGGTFAMALVAIILLALLLPSGDRAATEPTGQLALSDTTPTPSLAPTNTPVPTEAVTPTPELPQLTDSISKAGTVSPLMPDIQKRLVELGYMTEPDGGYTTKYGPTTKTAIRLFQVKNFEDYHDWDGVIGQGTYELLMSADAKAYYLARGDGDDRTKELTKLVQDVTDLQNRLITLGYLTAGSATGLYGATTVQAVQKFQEYHGLTPIDGKAGQATLKMLYSTEAMDATTGKANNNRSKMSPTPSASVDPSATAAATTTAPTAVPTVTPVP